MIEIGYVSLFIALIVAAFSALLSYLGARKKKAEFIASSKNGVFVVCILITIASSALLYALINRDFGIEYVANYTNRTLPLLYTITAFYAGQEGSLLFWVWLLSIFSTILLLKNKDKNRNLIPYIIFVLMGITFFFLLLLTVVNSPFNRLPQIPEDGKGLNPLLQNPGMIFHPITLYIGYVGFSIPFAYAIAALITGQLGEVWIRSTRRWTLFSWFFLTLGNLFGAKWAYVELGWGGYWAWDPVENASLMPWLVATAYLHSVMIQEKRGMLKIWNIVLIIFTFLLTIFGTFITRSGIISSVHTFGQSSLGWIFLVFLGILFLVSFNLLIERLPQLKSRNELDSFLSRESTFLYNNLILVGISFATLWGTLFPIISEALRGIKITVGAPFFNKVNIPIGLALLLLTGLCPIIAWRKASFENAKRNLILPLCITLIGGLIFYNLGIRKIYPLLSFTFSVFVTASIIYDIYRATKARGRMTKEGPLRSLWWLVVRNKRRYGGYIVHIGMVLVFVGITGGAFKMEKQVALRKGESFKIKNYNVRYDFLSHYFTANKEVVAATLTLLREGKIIDRLIPEKNFHRGHEEQPTTEVAIHSSLKEDFYVILAGYEGDLVTLKILINPLIAWLWIGGIIISIGTLITLLPEREKLLIKGDK